MNLRKFSRSYKKLATRVLAVVVVLAAILILQSPSDPNILVLKIALLIIALAAVLFAPYWIPFAYRVLNKKKRTKAPSWLQQRRMQAIGFEEIDK